MNWFAVTVCGIRLLALKSVGARAEASPGMDSSIVVPTTFEADRVYVHLPMRESTSTLRFYTDTGGGLVVSSEPMKRLGIDPKKVIDPEAIAELGPDAQVIDAKSFNAHVTGPKLPDDAFPPSRT